MCILSSCICRRFVQRSPLSAAGEDLGFMGISATFSLSPLVVLDWLVVFLF